MSCSPWGDPFRVLLPSARTYTSQLLTCRVSGSTARLLCLPIDIYGVWWRIYKSRLLTKKVPLYVFRRHCEMPADFLIFFAFRHALAVNLQVTIDDPSVAGLLRETVDNYIWLTVVMAQMCVILYEDWPYNSCYLPIMIITCSPAAGSNKTI